MRISFTEPGNLMSFGVIKFHDFLFFFLLIILCFVGAIFVFILEAYLIGFYNNNERLFITNRETLLKEIKVSHYPHLEFIWTITPTLLLINMALPTFVLLYSMDILLDPEFTVKAIGNQWYWSYETNDFPWNNNKFAFDSYMLHQAELEIGEKRLLEVDNFLVIPSDIEIRLLITSRDVLHSFALPSLSIKMDAVPGRLNHYSLGITVPGAYFGQCSELCGPNHGFMPITVISQ